MPVDLLPAMNGDKEWSPENWSPRHRIVVALHLGGDKNKEIAEKIGISESRVSVILNDPRAIYEIERMSSIVADRTIDTSLRLKLYANEALDEIVEEIRTAKDPRVRQKAAFGLLDRAGYTPTREDREGGDPVLPEDVVQRMEETTKELTAARASYETVEPKEKEPEPEPQPMVYHPDPGEARGNGAGSDD